MLMTEELSFLSDILTPAQGKSAVVSGTEKNSRLLSAVWAFGSGAGTVLFVCKNDFEARNTAEELASMLPEGSVLTYPCESFYFSLPDSYSTVLSVERLRALEALRNGEKKLIVTSAFALCETYPAPPPVSGSYRVGDTLERDSLIEALSSMGYVREDRVFSRGQFSVRGGIVDFFSPSDELPVRVEFWDDEIDSIRRFSPEDLLTVENGDSFRITSFEQYTVPAEDLRGALERFSALRDEALCLMEEGEMRSLASSESAALIERIRTDPAGASRLLYPLCDTERTGILSEAREDSLIIFNDLSVLEAGVKDSLKRAAEDLELLSEKAMGFPCQMEMFRSLDDVIGESRGRLTGIYFCSSDEDRYAFADTSSYMGGADVINYRGNLRLFLPALEFYRENDYRVIICCNGEAETQGCGRLLESYNLKYSSSPSPSSVAVMDTGMLPGVDFPSRKLVLVPYRYLMPSASSAVRKSPERSVEEFFSDIKPGDYVVHDTHGIGIFEGMVRLDMDGVSRDYIKVAYAANDILFMPPEQMDLIQKYVGAGEAPPKVNRLGSAEWTNTKKKVSKAVKELAAEYIAMYASRQSIKGYSFEDDTVYQTEFEEGFEYTPTEDQIRCSEEIKRDMEKPVPMDRLLMGDVGFGKTEVAMRAAFKAVMEPKQVAVLVPTTILALQHYNNFVERFRGYPVNIALMCRFRTPSQMKKTAEAVRKGEVDILIGTHRILSSDVVFRDLGLLIIDEEQRFGVAHKDRLKLMKNNVDTLTLSATPIPRTMHMSLSGIRDMSVINTPPADRLEVQTFVMPSDDTVIKSAILNEVSRGGQVFYLYNKVETISERALRLSAMLPGVRVCYAHGQMDERQLEKKVLDFLEGAYDVMVCTTIIENGVDMVNANTIIIEDADRLGLSQLYQLRGRVGRGNIRAYAYMLYNPHKEMNENARKRLDAIKEFTRFGSGFRIAMRDLQIRGSGNILGANQSGHFANVGYEMYCRLLSRAVAESTGEAPPEPPKVCEINLRADAYIPKDYIESEEDRILAYRKISMIEDRRDMERVIDELTDIYSDVPEPTLELLKVALLKALSTKGGISRVDQDHSNVIFTFCEGVSYDASLITEVGKKYPVRFRQKQDATQMLLDTRRLGDVLWTCCDLMESLVCN